MQKNVRPLFFRKTIPIMKLSLITISILCCTAAGLKANNTIAQSVLEKKITLHVKDMPLKDCLDKIASTAGVSFTYSSQVISAGKVNADADNKRISDVLN